MSFWFRVDVSILCLVKKKSICMNSKWVSWIMKNVEIKYPPPPEIKYYQKESIHIVSVELSIVRNNDMKRIRIKKINDLLEMIRNWHAQILYDVK